MKRIILGFCFLVFMAVNSSSQEKDFPVLKGPYLGQKPPGIIPEVFAPGLISTHLSQSFIAFLNGARVCVFSTSTERGHETYYTYEKKGRWTVPRRAPFEELQGHPNYTTGPLGRKVYFHSGNPTHADDTIPDDNIWTIEWTGSGWAKPVVLPAPANSEYGEAYPSATADGTVYFFTWRREGTRGNDVWFSRCVDGNHQEAERLPWPINTDFIEYDPYVAPDESFLIFGSDRPGGFGKSDNYICFRKEDGNWTHPINLGRPFNSSSGDLCANGTPDGKYFFFLSGRKTEVDKGDIGKTSGEAPKQDSDLYWVDFSFINDLKNTLLSKQNAAEIIKQDYGENGIQSAIDTLNTLFADQKDSTFFPPFELLSLSKDMMVEGNMGDADLFSSALDQVMPEDLSIKEGYARLCVMNGHVSKGLKIFEELDSENPNFNLSDALSALGFLFTLYPDKTDDALSVLQFTVNKFPDDPWAYFSLARIYRRLGDLDKAIANCRKSLELRPNVGDISQLLERLLEERERKRESEESFAVLTGPYFGLKPPGKKAELFAPQFITYEVHESPCLSQNLKEMFIGSMEEGTKYYKMIDGVWTLQNALPFDLPPGICNGIFISPSSKRIYFLMWEDNDENFYFSEKKEGKWMKPSPIGEEVNSFPTHWQFSTAKNENLYFSSGDIILVSVFDENKHLKPVPVELENDQNMRGVTPFISPDESYLIFSLGYDKEDTDLYISYRLKNNKWTKPINLDSSIIAEGSLDLCPKISPDGKYLFFISRRSGPDFRIFWADACFIEDLRPSELK